MAHLPLTVRAIAGAALILGVAPPLAAMASPAQEAEPAQSTTPSAAAQEAPAGTPQDMSSDAMVDMVDGMTVDEALGMVAMSDIPPEIIITGSRLRARVSDTASSAILSGAALETQARATIGETLLRIPGASSTAFGPAASRPVLRGFQGERARIFIDGVGTLDASNTSPDHAVALNPLVADRIEVLRGPVSLLYAAGSLGGVINTVSGRIPRRGPRGDADGALAASFASASNERSAGARIDAGLGGGFVLHADGQYLAADDIETGGFILAPGARAQAAASPDAGIRALANLRGAIPNTDVETWEAAGGLSYVFDGGHAGIAFANYESVYGLPTRFSLDPANPVPDTRIDLDQQRIDLRAEYNPGGVVDSIRARFAWADYQHNEVLPDGSFSAQFFNNAYEARVEAVLGKASGWRATLGGQHFARDFSVVGPAPLLPPNETTSLGLFAMQEVPLGALRLEGTVRWERTTIRSAVDPILLNPAIGRDLGTWSFAGGANYALYDDWKVAANIFYSERAPVVEELFTQGVDPGTQGLLIGNPALAPERSWGVEGVLRGRGQGYEVTANAYYTRFSSLIFAGENGVTVGGLPVFQFLQSGATYWGFEAQAKLDLLAISNWDIKADGIVDYVRATLADGSRVPPLRLLGGLEGSSPRMTARAELEWVGGQDRVSAFESPTRGFAMANLSMSWKPISADSKLVLRVTASNLFDATGRRHASLIKDFAPLAGRDIRLALRYGF